LTATGRDRGFYDLAWSAVQGLAAPSLVDMPRRMPQAQHLVLKRQMVEIVLKGL
jgi:hypothetical protein